MQTRNNIAAIQLVSVVQHPQNVLEHPWSLPSLSLCMRGSLQALLRRCILLIVLVRKFLRGGARGARPPLRLVSLLLPPASVKELTTSAADSGCHVASHVMPGLQPFGAEPL